MERGDSSFDAIQRWMQAVIVHVDGVAAGMESSSAQAAIPVSPADIERLICRSHAQTSIERLSVYSNAYWARLLDVLSGDYPALAHALGADVFAGMSSAYLQAHPPGSYTLADLGRHFPDYLANSRPPNQNEEGSPDWADFLIDLAKLERTYSEIFDGPGIEDHAMLQAGVLTGISDDEWLGIRLIPAPCFRLASFQFPVHEYASAVRQQKQADFPEPQPTFLGITRRDYIVRRVALEYDEFAVLADLMAGKRVGAALECALANSSRTIDELATDVRRWFRNWSAAAYFIGVRKDETPAQK